MVKLMVCYGQPDDPSAFDEHYATIHRGLAEKMPNLRRFEAGKVLGSPDGQAAPYYFVAELYFDDAQALQEARASQAGRAAADDVATFASGGVTIMIAET